MEKNIMLKEAWETLKKAWQELESYRSTKDHMILRDAAEKGWLAVDKAVEALLKTYGVEAKTYKEKRDHLLKLGFDLLRERFAAREKFLHIDCFYDGLCDEEFVLRELDKIEKMLREIENMIEEIERNKT
jgi:hypothetical protein